MFELVTAFVLLGIGLLIGGVLLYLLTFSLRPLFRGGRETARIKRAALRLEEADTLIQERKFKEAITVIRQTVLFEEVHTPQLVEMLKNHHQNILSRCLVISEELGNRPEQIAEVERLFIERAELQKLFLKAVESFQSIRDRREKAGKALPSWSSDDFKNRIQEIKKELKRNKEALNDSLTLLFKSLTTESPEDSIVYH